jgi:hypothetical protein
MLSAIGRILNQFQVLTSIHPKEGKDNSKISG